MKKTITIGLFLLGLLPVFGQWNTIDDLPGAPIDGACSFFIGDKYYVGGGVNSNSFYELDTETDSWTQKADIPGSAARGWAIGFSIDGKGYVGGGDSGGFILTSDFYEYTPENDSWQQIADFGGGVRDGVFSCSLNGKAYVFGGFDGSYTIDEVWEFDSTTGDWSQKSDFPGGPCIFPTGFVVNDKIYVGTGSTSGSDGNNYFYQYDPVADTWTQKADIPGEPKQACVGFAVNNIGYIGGGQVNFTYTLPDFYAYDIGNDVWSEVDHLDFEDDDAVAWSTAAANGETVYMGTGADLNDGLNLSNAFYKTSIQTVGLEEHQNKFNIYPNPSSGLLYIDSQQFEIGTQVSIENLSGQQVYHSKAIQQVTDLSRLPQGVYIIRLLDPNGYESSQLFMRK